MITRMITRAKRLIAKAWGNPWVKEFILFVVTSSVVVVVAQLQALDDLFASGASIGELSTWAAGAASAILVTAIRQSIAWALARLAGSRL